MAAVDKRIIEIEPGDGLIEADPGDLTAACRIEAADTGVSVDLELQNVSLSLPSAVIAAALLADSGEQADIGYYYNLPTTSTGTPEGSVRGKPGRICTDISASPKALYSKITGTGTAGWQIMAG